MFARRIRQMVAFLKREDGPTAVEYAVMLALIIVVCVAVVSSLGQSTSETFNDASLRDALTAEGDDD